VKLSYQLAACVTLAVCFTAHSVIAELTIDDNLEAKMNEVGKDGTVSALIYLDSSADIKALSDSISQNRLSFHDRHKLIVETLQNEANASQKSILKKIGELRTSGGIERVKTYWITNAIRIDATPSVILELSTHEDVNHIYLNYPIELVEPVSTGPVGQDRGGVEIGIDAVRAPEVWAMGFDGDGVLVSTMDTGVQGSHEALASRWAGLRPEYAGHPEWAFLDPYTGDHSFPFDSGSHGTHTMGTVCGGSPGQGIGVAPGAHWITSAAIDRYTIEQTVADAITSFQWLADPDGDPSTSWDVPRVNSNSWGLTTGHGYPNCDQTFWTYLDNLEAVGCVVLFSAGNEGSSGLRRPGDRATDDYRTCAVAAIDPYDSNWPIASFSSRGPTNCTPNGSSAIKPDIAAPGVDTYSSVPGGYSSYSGTSMASPHVNGAVALMLQANPDLEVEMIKQILYETAIDLGATGEDNDYGAGMIDCVEAVNKALETVSLTWSYPSGRPEWLEPTGGTEIPIVISSNQAVADPSTAMLHIFEGTMIFDYPLVHDGGPNYHAVFPELSCGESVSYFFSIETTDGDLSSSPFSAPDTTWVGDAWSGYEASFDDNFQSDTGWTVYSGAGTGNWIRVVPSQGGVRCDAGTDSDGSGMCYVTGNSYEEDVDDGITILTSPILDASSPSATLNYDFWYNNGSNCNGADPQNDVMEVDISDDGGSSWNNLEIIGPTGGEVSGGWFTRSWIISDIPNVEPSANMQIRFTVGDLNDPSVVEAGVDAIRLGYHYCNENVCQGDINDDGFVDVIDLLSVIDQWGASDSPADVNGDGIVNVSDLLAIVDAWGACQ
jgi:subtilisin family serine protease